MADFTTRNPLEFPGVRIIEATDRVTGGVGNGPNIPLEELAARTDFLKQAVDDFVASSQNLEAGTDYVDYTALLDALSTAAGDGLLRKQGNAISTVPNWVDNSVAGGRLALVSGNPDDNTSNITSSDRIYYTPYTGSTIALFSSSEWRYFTFSEISFPLAGIPTDTNVDIFADLSGSNVVLQAQNWTNDSTRAIQLTRLNGIWTLVGNSQRRYLGTLRTVGAGVSADSDTKRYVWNVGNQIPKVLRRQDPGANWTYNSDVWQPMNNDTANRVEIVAGFNSGLIDLQILGTATDNGQLAIGVNSITDPVVGFGLGKASASQATTVASRIQPQPAQGYNFFQALESSQLGSTSEFIANRTAISGRWMC